MLNKPLYVVKQAGRTVPLGCPLGEVIPFPGQPELLRFSFLHWAGLPVRAGVSGCFSPALPLRCYSSSCVELSIVCLVFRLCGDPE